MGKEIAEYKEDLRGYGTHVVVYKLGADTFEFPVPFYKGPASDYKNIFRAHNPPIWGWREKNGHYTVGPTFVVVNPTIEVESMVSVEVKIASQRLGSYINDYGTELPVRGTQRQLVETPIAENYYYRPQQVGYGFSAKGNSQLHISGTNRTDGLPFSASVIYLASPSQVVGYHWGNKVLRTSR